MSKGTIICLCDITGVMSECATVEKMKDVFYALYDAIAAGKIPHIRID